MYATIFSEDVLRGVNTLFALLLLRALWTAPWRAFWTNHLQFNLLIGLAGLFSVLWLLPVGVRPGLMLHPLGATLLFLIFDWHIATLLLSAILLVTMHHQGTPLSTFGIIGGLLITLPIELSRLGLRAFYRYGKPSYSSFVAWNGYVVGTLTLLLSAIVNGLIVLSIGKYSSMTMQNYFWIAAPLMSTAESIITGMVISGIALTSPRVMVHFNPEIYFAQHPRQN